MHNGLEGEEYGYGTDGICLSWDMNIIISQDVGQVLSYEKEITLGVFNKAVPHEYRSAAGEYQCQLTFLMVMKGFIESWQIPVFHPYCFFILSRDLEIYRFHEELIYIMPFKFSESYFQLITL
jgi:hypothetical protein